MKGHYNIIGQWTDGNVTTRLVEWRIHNDVEFEVVLVVDGDPVSMTTVDLPRVVRLLKEAVGAASGRVEELAKDELLPS